MNRWPRRACLAALGALAGALLSSGCITSTPQIHQVARGLEQSMPGTTFEPEGGVKLGRISLGLARWIGGHAIKEAGRPEDGTPEDGRSEAGNPEVGNPEVGNSQDGDPPLRQGLRALSGVHRVEAGNFRVVGLRADLGPTSELERSLSGNGWQTLARVRDGEQQAWVVYRLRGRHLRSLMVVALEDDELSLVRLEGRLEDTLTAALHIARGEAVVE